MERGIYFDGWRKHEFCYHPSLPLRDIRMRDDLKRYHGTVLVWAGMGGGSISLPYLEEEAFGEVPPRLRIYGHMNDSEFAVECGKLGIKLFGIVFEVQGWEFPAVFDAEGHLLRLNEHAEEQDHDWYGLREFTQDKYPNAFRTSLKDYYPDGIVNSAGETVTDIREECCARDYHGVPIHAEWVEVKGRKQTAYQMCRNNPVWRDYLKKIIKIQIDAGVQGIQLDECELPMTAIGSGGCFCRDCVREFSEYLVQKKAAGELSAEWDGIDVAHFNYKEFLLEGGYVFPRGKQPGPKRGCYKPEDVRSADGENAHEAGALTADFYDAGSTEGFLPADYYDAGNAEDLRPADDVKDVQEAPFFKDYWEFQVCEVRKYFSELVDFAKDYAKKTRGMDLPVSGNFYNLQPAYHPIVPKADIIITEMEHTLFRQPFFFRYSAGFAEGKPVIVAENPYGGIIPSLLELLDQGKARDLYRLYLLEASVYGCNMSVPYGAWMGNTIRDAFWPPRSVTTQVQDFLYDHEDCFPRGKMKGAAVLYSYGSNYWRDAHRGGSANGDAEEANKVKLDVMTTDWGNSDVPMPFWDVIRHMSAENALYDVVMMPDGVLRPDDFATDALDGYRMLVIPDCHDMTKKQEQAVYAYAKTGAPVLVYGRYSDRTGHAEELRQMGNVRFVDEDLAEFSEAFDTMYAPVSTVICKDRRIGMNRYDSEEGAFIHLLNYDYDEEKDRVAEIPALEVVVTDCPDGRIEMYRLDGREQEYIAKREGEKLILTLRNVSLYTVIAVR